MKLTRRNTVVVALVSLLMSAGLVQAQEKSERGRPRDGMFARMTHLLPPGSDIELNLTAEQHKHVQTMEAQFKDKRRAALIKAALNITNIVKSLEAEDDKREPAPVLAIAHEVTGALLEMRRTRVVYERKVLALLDAGQQERFHTLKEARPGDRREPRERRPSDAPKAGGLHGPDLKERLNLTPVQQKQLADLHRDFEGRLRGILTPEQQQRLDCLSGGSRPERPAGRVKEVR